MNELLKRLWCEHFYIDMGLVLGWPDPQHLYKCERCDKEIVRRSELAPVNPIKESPWEVYAREVARGNAAYVMAPTLQIRQKGHHEDVSR